MLCVRTDKPEAELYIYEDDVLLSELKWEAHRQLAETIHYKIDELLSSTNHSLDDLQKICVYQGPGSFTGLRIGITVANTLAYALHIPIVGGEGEEWLAQCSSSASSSSKQVTPKYGSDPHITKQKK